MKIDIFIVTDQADGVVQPNQQAQDRTDAAKQGQVAGNQRTGRDRLFFKPPGFCPQQQRCHECQNHKQETPKEQGRGGCDFQQPVHQKLEQVWQRETQTDAQTPATGRQPAAHQVMEVTVNISCTQRKQKQADTRTERTGPGGHSQSQRCNGNTKNTQKSGQQLAELFMGKPAEGEPEQEKTHDRRRYQPQIHLHGAKLPGKGQGRGEQGNVNHHVDEEQSAVK